MSAHCSDPNCRTCGAVPVRKAEIRNGRRYIDGRDVGPAVPDQYGAHTRKGGEAPRRARRRP